MTRKETGIIMDILTTAYPRFYSGTDAPDMRKTVNLWAEMFADDPVELVAAGVKSLIASDDKGYPPHIGAVKNAIHSLVTSGEADADEAWAQVRKAIRNSAYDSAKEYKKLPADVQRIVGSASQLRDWAMMDTEIINSVVYSNFLKAYRHRQEKTRQMDLLPADVKTALGAFVKPLEIEGDVG